MHHFDLNEKNVAKTFLGTETKHITDLLSTLNLKFAEHSFTYVKDSCSH